MPYRISKKVSDARVVTCGLEMPDGFYRVVEMKLSNTEQIKNLRNFGYLVEECDEKPGAYTLEGREVSVESLNEAWSQGKPIRFIDEPEETESVSGDSDTELQAIRAELDERGIKYRADAKVSTLQKKLNEPRVA